MAVQPLYRWLESSSTSWHRPPKAPRLHEVQGLGPEEPQHRARQLTELRHDTILYAKQSVPAEGDGGERPQDTDTSSPTLTSTRRSASWATTLRQTLLDHELIDSVSANKLEMMISLTDSLRSIAQKELVGEELTADEIITITEYGHYLEILEQFKDSEEGRPFPPTPEKSPLVADVHSSYNTGKALEEATGYPLNLYTTIEMEGKVWSARAHRTRSRVHRPAERTDDGMRSGSPCSTTAKRPQGRPGPTQWIVGR